MKKLVMAALTAVLLLCGCQMLPSSSQSSEPEPPGPEKGYFDGVEVNEETGFLTVGPESPLSEISLLTEHLTGLKCVTFQDREPAARELDYLRRTFPGIDLFYNVDLAGTEISNTDTEADLPGLRRGGLNSAVLSLQKLENLKKIRLYGAIAGGDITFDDLDWLQERFPDLTIDYVFDIWGKQVSLLDESLDLSHVKMDDGGAAVRAVLPRMKNCTYLDMDSCGVSNEDMAALRDDFPNIKVVWRIWFGRYFTCRTDTEKVLAATLDGNVTGANGAALKYCTEVRYLDLGHNKNLDDISFVQYMPKLEVAILAINSWSDASPLANCKELEYLEMFNTRCTDLTPLLGLTKLRHLNVSYLWGLSDISPLYQMTYLERLWIGRDNRVPRAELLNLQASLPNTEVNITNSGDPTSQGWRRHERYWELRRQFGYTDADYAIW